MRTRANPSQRRPLLGTQGQPRHIGAAEQPARLQIDQLRTFARQQIGIHHDRLRRRGALRQPTRQPTAAHGKHPMPTVGERLAQRQVHLFDVLGQQLLHRERQGLA
ncbi:hypothetical protein D9M68_848610 [compost metagenome]